MYNKYEVCQCIILFLFLSLLMRLSQVRCLLASGRWILRRNHTETIKV